MTSLIILINLTIALMTLITLITLTKLQAVPHTEGILSIYAFDRVVYSVPQVYTAQLLMFPLLTPSEMWWYSLCLSPAYCLPRALILSLLYRRLSLVVQSAATFASLESVRVQ
jgi:hypothetical protein